MASALTSWLNYYRLTLSCPIIVVLYLVCDNNRNCVAYICNNAHIHVCVIMNETKFKKFKYLMKKLKTDEISNNNILYENVGGI